jgi:hypothetical protein
MRERLPGEIFPETTVSVLGRSAAPSHIWDGDAGAGCHFDATYGLLLHLFHPPTRDLGRLGVS